MESIVDLRALLPCVSITPTGDKNKPHRLGFIDDAAIDVYAESMVPPASAASLAQYIRERIVPPHIWANDEELKLVRDSGKVRFCFGNSPLDFSELHEYLHRLEAEIIQSFGVPASIVGTPSS